MNIHKIIETELQNNRHKFRMLSNDTVNGNFSVGYVRKNRQRGHSIDMQKQRYDLVMVLSGTGLYKDEVRGEIPLKAGDCVQRLPGRKHTTCILDDDWSELYISMGQSIYESLKPLSVAATSPVLNTGVDFEMIQLYLEIHKKMDTSTGVEVPLLIPKAIELMARAAYLHRIHSRTTEEAEVLKMSIAYIKENPGSRLSVEDVASHVNMGYEKFRKLFLHYYGISPGNFILNQRIRAAQLMLPDTALTVKEISAELGYRDSAAFSKQFKKVTGHTPTEFRRTFRI